MIGLLLLGSIHGATVIRSRPPAPRPVDAGDRGFSTWRARERLGRVLQDGRPHPVGSAENARVRERLQGELRALGFDPTVQPSFACSPRSTCAPVVNVVAVTRGEGPVVLLACHHDSVAAGPGTSDDGAGMAAALEIAHVIGIAPELSQRIGFLFTDGEEGGLLGARAFVREHPLARDVGVVINLEARGTTGAAAMFETSAGNAALVEIVAAHAPRPIASSVLYALYLKLPNDTDLTIFKRAGMAGLNFAFAEGLTRYHTPRDDFAHLDLGSLQHLGDQALGCVRALAASEEPYGRGGDAVFFDVLSLGILRWPKKATLPIALAAALPVVLSLALGLSRRDARLGATLLGVVSFLLASAFGVGAGFALPWLLQGIRGDRPWAAYPGPTLLALGTAGVLGAVLPAWILGEWAGVRGLALGHGASLAVLSVIGALAMPEASYLAIVPSASFGLALLAALAFPSLARVLLLGATAVGALPALELARVLAIMVGPDIGPATALPWAVAATGLAPFALGRPGLRALAVLLLVLASGFSAALLVPAATPDAPAPVNVTLRQEDARADWILRAWGGAPPAEMRSRRPFVPRPLAVFPWSRISVVHAAEAPAQPLPRPSLDVLQERPEGGRRLVLARLWSPRGAPTISLAASRQTGARIRSVEGWNLGSEAAGGSSAYPGWRVCTVRGLPEGGVQVELHLPAAPVELVLVDASPGLPRGGADILAARPVHAAPMQDGDETVVIRRLVLAGTP